jgi:DNA-binding NtrC family response regulator
MPARVVVVHDEPDFIDRVVGALRRADLDVAAMADPLAALDALEASDRIEVLVTRVQFGPGKPNGVTLARMARTKRPGIRILFTARAEFEEYADGLGEFMAAPINVPDVVAAVERLLKSYGQDSS